MRHPALVLLALGIVTLPACAGGASVDPADVPVAGEGTSATVVRVIDGDTVRVLIDGDTEAVRLLGVDTPEVENPHRPAGCYGREASAFTRAALPPGSRVVLTADPSQGRRDRFGRLLAYVDTAPGRGVMASVNARLLRGGYARVYVVQRNPFAHAEVFREAQRVARDARRGLWGACRDGWRGASLGVGPSDGARSGPVRSRPFTQGVPGDERGRGVRQMKMALAAGACAVTLAAGAVPATAGTAWSTGGTAGVELRWKGKRVAPTSLTLIATRDGQTAAFTGLRRGGWGVPVDDAIVAVRDLDRDGEPELLANLAKRGERGARRTVVIRWVPADGRHRLTVQDWGAAGHRLRDLDRDGRPEFVSHDARWAGFAGMSGAATLPVRIWRFDAGEMVDVTRRFRREVRADMAGHWKAIAAAERRGGSPRAAISAYMAGAHLMGRPAAAWTRVRARHTAPGADRFFAALERRLVTLGYATTPTA